MAATATRLTSPGRPEKLVRGKSGNRSRGRSLSHAKSTPMFIMGRKCRNGRSSAVGIPDGKDPGSPKVTCIGQVTIKKRAKKKKLDSAGEKRERKKDREPCCRWLKGGSLFRNPFSTKKNSGTGGTPPPRPLSMWRRWSSCWWSYRKKILKEEENSGNVGTVAGLLDRFEWICEKKEEQALEEAFVPATPPKNALLLMRCRSAPHRSSALVAGDVVKETNQPPPADIAGNVKSERIHEENDIYPDNVSNGPSCGGSLKDEEDHDAASFSSRPLLLSRSNSGPAKLTNRVGLLDREDRGGLGGCKLQEGERSNERINECIDFESGAPCR